MGWLAILLLALLVLAGLWQRAGLRGATLQFVAAALLFAFAGYAWQGRPGLAGREAPPPSSRRLPESEFARTRLETLGRFDTAGRWLTIAEGYQRRGNTQGAVGVIKSAIRAHPDDPELWLGLGDALRIHAGGMMTPAADLAFQRAASLAPNHPAPRFFYGLALAQAGQVEGAERVWRALLADAPATAEWRRQVEERLTAIDHARATGALP